MSQIPKKDDENALVISSLKKLLKEKDNEIASLKSSNEDLKELKSENQMMKDQLAQYRAAIYDLKSKSNPEEIQKLKSNLEKASAENYQLKTEINKLKMKITEPQHHAVSPPPPPPPPPASNSHNEERCPQCGSISISGAYDDHCLCSRCNNCGNMF